jgi:hypothetical protein
MLPEEQQIGRALGDAGRGLVPSDPPVPMAQIRLHVTRIRRRAQLRTAAIVAGAAALVAGVAYALPSSSARGAIRVEDLGTTPHTSTRPATFATSTAVATTTTIAPRPIVSPPPALAPPTPTPVAPTPTTGPAVLPTAPVSAPTTEPPAPATTAAPTSTTTTTTVAPEPYLITLTVDADGLHAPPEMTVPGPYRIRFLDTRPLPRTNVQIIVTPPSGYRWLGIPYAWSGAYGGFGQFVEYDELEGDVYFHAFEKGTTNALPNGVAMTTFNAS